MPGRLGTVELVVLRHADAERKADRDFDRALTKKGKADAAAAGERLVRANLRPALVLSSPAPRALETARLAVAAFGADAPAIVQDPAIYDASLETLRKVLARHGGTAPRVLLVGHNPGLSDLASWLANLPSGWSLSKGAAAHMRLRASWSDLSKSCGRLIDVHEDLGPDARPAPKPEEAM